MPSSRKNAATKADTISPNTMRLLTLSQFDVLIFLIFPLNDDVVARHGDGRPDREAQGGAEGAKYCTSFSAVLVASARDLRHQPHHGCGPEWRSSRAARSTLLTRPAIHQRPLEVTLR